MSFNIRLQELVKYLGENPTSFANGLQRSSIETIRKLMNNVNANPTLKTVLDIIEKYPQISLEWLITGTGSMEKIKGYVFNDFPTIVHEPNSEENQLYSDSKIYDTKKAFNALLDELIELRKENRELKNKLKEL